MGPTYTLAGHTALITGNYQEINNIGRELPEYPSIFQYWNKKYSHTYGFSRIFTSKDNLAVLSDCLNSDWNGLYRLLFDCGIDGTGVGSGYRSDSLNLMRVTEAITVEHPRLVFLSFRNPDFSAHSGDWEAYLAGIKNTDRYVSELWEFIENNSFYSGKTALFITNDHGRYLDNVKDGFVSHGDTCSGCRHVSLLAIGPDFKHGKIIKISRELIDIPATMSEFLGLSMTTGKGEIMNELFK